MEGALGTGLLWVRDLRTRGKRQWRLGAAGQVPQEADSEEKSNRKYIGSFPRINTCAGRRHS